MLFRSGPHAAEREVANTAGPSAPSVSSPRRRRSRVQDAPAEVGELQDCLASQRIRTADEGPFSNADGAGNKLQMHELEFLVEASALDGARGKDMQRALLALLERAQAVEETDVSGTGDRSGLVSTSLDADAAPDVGVKEGA